VKRVTAPWLGRPESQAVLSALSAGGFRALYVGGCVRNAVRGESATDIDIATDALPDEVIRLATAAGLKALPTGIEHGTVTVVSDGLPHEVTTFRKDVETDGRHAVVAYSTSVSEDALRRDFTMNALYAEADGTLVDPLGGLADALAGKVRFIEDAGRRIAEDTLRILRFFRFQAWYGDPAEGPDPDGLAACADAIDGLAGLSHERIGAEMKKLLAAPDPAPAVAAFAAIGGLVRVLKGSDPKALAPLVHLEATIGCAPDPIRRLAVLAPISPAVALRLSRAEQRQWQAMRNNAGSAQGPAELGYRHGRDLARDIALVRAALLETGLSADLMQEVGRGCRARFPISAADLMPEFQGPALGARLAELEERWIASDFALGKAALLGG
jgi:poly(A) polymerase